MFKTINTIACYDYSDEITATSTYNCVRFYNWKHFLSFNFYVEFFVLACDELKIQVYDKDGKIIKEL